MYSKYFLYQKVLQTTWGKIFLFFIWLEANLKLVVGIQNLRFDWKNCFFPTDIHCKSKFVYFKDFCQIWAVNIKFIGESKRLTLLIFFCQKKFSTSTSYDQDICTFMWIGTLWHFLTILKVQIFHTLTWLFKKPIQQTWSLHVYCPPQQKKFEKIASKCKK